MAWVKRTNRVEIYVNGNLIYTFQESGITSRNLPTSLSGVVIGVNLYGYFDDFRLSDTALNPSELGYHQPFTTIPEPSAAGLMMPAAVAMYGYLARRKKQAS